MPESASAHISRERGYVEAKFHRQFDHSAGELWGFLTEPERLPQWLAPGKIGDEVGAPAKLDFKDSGIVIDSLVTAYEAGRLLEYSWSGPGEPYRMVRWRLEPSGPARCELALILRVPDAEDAARAFAGWDAHLEMLAAALEGVPIRFPFDHFKAQRAVYADELQQAA